ncbi:MAG: RNA polymerase factor sigma-32 [Azospirillaceae bacterium]|nr:RNA polymerase factor sigma-32 [Azospirillaceae bacterium]
MTHFDDQQTQRSNLAYIRDSMRAPMLSRDHELVLAERWRDHRDQAALHELVQSFARLVIATATRFRHYGLPLGDLVQEGNVGLMQAALRFEPQRDVRFSTYATWWIRSAIQDYVLRNWSIVRTGTTAAQKSLFFNLRRLRAQIAGDNGAAGLTDDGRRQIAAALNVDEDEVVAMEQRLAGADQSLNVPIGENSEDDWQDFLADPGPTPEEVVINLRDAETRSRWLAEALTTLNTRERLIIRERQLRDHAATLDDLGRQLGISKERVRQIEARAIQKLRAAMLQRAEDPRAPCHAA